MFSQTLKTIIILTLDEWGHYLQSKHQSRSIEQHASGSGGYRRHPARVQEVQPDLHRFNSPRPDTRRHQERL